MKILTKEEAEFLAFKYQDEGLDYPATEGYMDALIGTKHEKALKDFQSAHDNLSDAINTIIIEYEIEEM